MRCSRQKENENSWKAQPTAKKAIIDSHSRSHIWWADSLRESQRFLFKVLQKNSDLKTIEYS